jgi:hypothetical protein
MKKLIATILLLTLFGCGPSLEERQATNKACAQKHFAEMTKVYQANPQQLFTDLCVHNKIENNKCFEFIAMASQYGRLQEEVTKFAVERAEEICGKYPVK